MGNTRTRRAGSIEVDSEGWNELDKALSVAVKMFPASTEDILKKETQELRKQIKNSYVGSTLKSKTPQWAKKLREKPKTALEKSFATGKVIRSGTKYTSAVTSKAPHYHLVEDGHEASGWYKNRYPDAQKVRGKKIVAKIMARRSENAEEIGQRLLEEIFKDAGAEWFT